MSNSIIIQQAQAMILFVITNRCDTAAGQNNALPHATKFPYDRNSLDPLSPNFEVEQVLIQFFRDVYLLLTQEAVLESAFETVINQLSSIHKNYPNAFKDMIEDPNSNEILLFLYFLDISNHSHIKFKRFPLLDSAFLGYQSDNTKFIIMFCANAFIKSPSPPTAEETLHFANVTAKVMQHREKGSSDIKLKLLFVLLKQTRIVKTTLAALEQTQQINWLDVDFSFEEITLFQSYFQQVIEIIVFENTSKTVARKITSTPQSIEQSATDETALVDINKADIEIVLKVSKFLIQQLATKESKKLLEDNPIYEWINTFPEPKKNVEQDDNNKTKQTEIIQSIEELLNSVSYIEDNSSEKNTVLLNIFSNNTPSSIKDYFLQLAMCSIVLSKIESNLAGSQKQTELSLRCLATFKIGLKGLGAVSNVNELTAYTSILFAAIKYSQAFGLYQHPHSPCRQIMQDLAHRFLIQFPKASPEEHFNDDDMWGLNLALQMLAKDIQFAEENKKPWPLNFISEEQFWLTCGYFIRLTTLQPPRISMLYAGLANKIFMAYQRLGLLYAHSETFINYKITLCKSMKAIFSMMNEDMEINLPWSSVDFEGAKSLWKSSIECLVEEPRTPQLVFLCSMLMEPIVTTLLTFNLFKETKNVIDTFLDLSNTFKLDKSFDKHVYSSLGLMLQAFERADYIKNISQFCQRNIIKKPKSVTAQPSLQHTFINYTLNALLKACADDLSKNEFSSSVLLIEHLISILGCGKQHDTNIFNKRMVLTKNMIEALYEFMQLLINLTAQEQTTTKNKSKPLNKNLLAELFNNDVYSYVPLFRDAIVFYLIERTKSFFNSSSEVSYEAHNVLIVAYNQLKSLFEYLNISSAQLDSLAAAFQLDGLEKKRAAIELSLLEFDAKEKAAKSKKNKKKRIAKKDKSREASVVINTSQEDIETTPPEKAFDNKHDLHEEKESLQASSAIDNIESTTSIDESNEESALFDLDFFDTTTRFEKDDWVTVKSYVKTAKTQKENLKTPARTDNKQIHRKLTSSAKSLTLLQVATIKPSDSSKTKTKKNASQRPNQTSLQKAEKHETSKLINKDSSFAWGKPLNTPINQTQEKSDSVLETTHDLNQPSELSENIVTTKPVIATTLITTKAISHIATPDEDVTEVNIDNTDPIFSFGDINSDLKSEGDTSTRELPKSRLSSNSQNLPMSDQPTELIVPFLPKALHKNILTYLPVSSLPEEFELLEIINTAFLAFYQEKNRAGMPLIVTGKTVSNFYTRTRPNDLDCSGYNITLIEQEEILRKLAKQHGWSNRSIHGIVGAKHPILLCNIPYKERLIKIDLSYLAPKQHGQNLLQPLIDDVSTRDKLSTAYHLIMYKTPNSNCYPVINALNLAPIILPTGHLKCYLDNDILEINSLLDQNIKNSSAGRQNFFSEDPIRVLRFIQDIIENPSIMIGQYLQSYFPSFANQIAQNEFWYMFLSATAQSPRQRSQTFFPINLTLSQSQLSTKLQHIFSRFPYSFERTQFLYDLLDRFGVLTGVINAAILNFDRENQIERMPDQRLSLVLIIKEEVRRQNTFAASIPYSNLILLIEKLSACHIQLRVMPNSQVAPSFK